MSLTFIIRFYSWSQYPGRLLSLEFLPSGPKPALKMVSMVQERRHLQLSFGMNLSPSLEVLGSSAIEKTKWFLFICSSTTHSVSSIQLTASSSPSKQGLYQVCGPKTTLLLPTMPLPGLKCCLWDYNPNSLQEHLGKGLVSTHTWKSLRGTHGPVLSSCPTALSCLLPQRGCS